MSVCSFGVCNPWVNVERKACSPATANDEGIEMLSKRRQTDPAKCTRPSPPPI